MYQIFNEYNMLSVFDPWISSGPSFGIIYTIIFAIYNKFAWKWQVLKLIGMPVVANLSGTYQGKLLSSYKDENGSPTEVSLTLEIEQTWTRIVVYLQTGTDTSESYSFMASLFEVDDKSKRLTYSYTNKPFNAIADPDMQPHDGTASLVFKQDGSVKGTYYNARTRTGTIVLKRQQK